MLCIVRLYFNCEASTIRAYTREELPLPLILSRLASINRLKSAIRSPKMTLSNCSLLTSCTPSATACSVSALNATSFHFLIIDFVGCLKQEYMREAILSLASMKSRQLLRIRLKSAQVLFAQFDFAFSSDYVCNFVTYQAY